MKKLCIASVLAVFLAGCGMSDSEVKEATGNAAVKVKRGAEYTAEQIKSGYNTAYAEGRKLAESAGGKLSDAVLKTKVLTGFKLIKGLDASNVTVETKSGVIYLTGTTPTYLDKMKAEGIAYGVAGDGKLVRSTLTIK